MSEKIKEFMLEEDTSGVVNIEENENESEISQIEHPLPSSLQFLVDGYLDYAKEVVVDRAIPGIDGLKPSQRRILYTMKYIEKVTDLSKSANIAGATMKIHPHGDSAIYDTMVRMTHSSLNLNVPYIHGKGSFGKVFSSLSRPAASRYTECMLEPVTEEFFKGMSGVEMIHSYNNQLLEPVLLPVSFPSILCNPTQGIAVGIASNIPPFNFHEVINATIELIEKGSITKPLVPDFTTGGYIVKNERELGKLMSTGNAKLRLRGKWRIEGKIIIIEEIPYYTTLEEIMKAVKDLPNVADVKDGSDRKGLRLTIECSTRKVVNEVLREVLRLSPLQLNVTSNIVIIVDNQPREIGVIDVLEEWVKFREKVVAAEVQKEITDLTRQIEYYDLLVDLMTTESKKEPFMETLMKQGRPESKILLREIYPYADEKIFDWILDKTIGSLAGIGNRQKNYLIELKEKRSSVEEDAGNIRGRIVRELKEINKKYKYPRKTEITDDDYIFDVKDIQKPEPIPVVVVMEGKFIKKLKNTPTNQKIAGAVKCMSDDIISFIDSNGRLIRVQLEHLDFVPEREKGMYIPLYLEEDDANYELLDYEVVKNKKVGYMYTDGYVAVIDYNEWDSAQRKTKLTPNGIAPNFIDLYLGNFRMDREYIIILTKRGKLGIATTDFIEKSRRARTKVINVGKGDSVARICSASQNDLEACLGNIDKFLGRFRVISKTDGFNQEVFDRLERRLEK